MALNYKRSIAEVVLESKMKVWKKDQLKGLSDRQLFIKVCALWQIEARGEWFDGIHAEYELSLEECRRRGYDTNALVNNIRSAHMLKPILFADLVDDTLPF